MKALNTFEKNKFLKTINFEQMMFINAGEKDFSNYMHNKLNSNW